MKRILITLSFAVPVIAQRVKVTGTVTAHNMAGDGYAIIEDNTGKWWDLGNKALPPMVGRGDHGHYILEVDYKAPTTSMMGPKATIKQVLIDIPASDYLVE